MMNRTVSKVDALAEMVRAFDQNDSKRSNKISNVIQRNINNETIEKKYKEFIEVNKIEKQLFPVEIRKTPIGEAEKEKKVVVCLEDGTYKMAFDENGVVSFKKNE